MSIVIGISGISGAGKSTLTQALAIHLNASSLYWDDFDGVSTSPGDYVDWFNRGRDYREFNYQSLAQTLHELKNEKSIIHPVTQETITPNKYIVVDAPLGRAHKQTAQYIDLFAHIDVPLDIALARRLIRDTKNNEINKNDIVSTLNEYLQRSRPLYDAEGMCLIANTADYIVDGTKSVEHQVDDLLAFLQPEDALQIEQNIKIDIVDKVSDEIEKVMRNGFVSYETKQGVDVNYKTFSLVLSIDTKPIGVLNAYTAFSEIYVNDLWVDEAYRRKGYGKYLLHHLTERFKGRGFNNINLVTSNFQAPAFYKKCGFKAEFMRINERNLKLSKTFFVKYLGEELQTQGLSKSRDEITALNEQQPSQLDENQPKLWRSPEQADNTIILETEPLILTKIKNNCFILTGGPGSGKSSVLDELKNRGYTTISEVGRKIIKEQRAIGGNATHGGDKIAFRDLMLKYSVADYLSVLNKEGTIFFDRGIPELYGYAKLIAEPVTQSINQAIDKYRYNPIVFIFPPWEEIYDTDKERTQDFKEAIDTYHTVKNAYLDCGYQLVEVPKDSIENRAAFVLGIVENLQKNKSHLSLDKIQLISASLEDYPVIQSMGRFYVYDMSEYLGWDIPKDGLYECINFKKYWETAEAFPFLIYYEQELAGFVIVDKNGSDPLIDFNMAQFFILRKFKNKRIGQSVACQCFDMFRGTWEVMVIPGNEGAYHFWHSVIRNYTQNQFIEYSKEIAHFNNSRKNIFCFDSHKD